MHSARSAARFAWGVLAYNVAVILWGAYVRASGSGAGCGNHWPLCNGVVVPQAPEAATIIEFTHRVTSGLALLAVVALAVWTWRVTVKPNPARRAAVAALVLMLNEAWLGALLVLLQRVGQDSSAGRAVLLSLHFANTFLLLAALAFCARWLSPERRQSTNVSGDRKRLAAVAAGLAAIVCVGASGTISALGDTLFPAKSLGAALHADVSSSSNFLLRLRVIHPALAVASLVFVLWLVIQSQNPRAVGVDRRPSTAVVIFFFTQIMLGMLNVALLAPVWLQLTHLLVAELFWVSVVVAGDELLRNAGSKTSSQIAVAS
ncbi:MAG: COX15/CtaA family protein [Terriglobales bacterium]